MACCSSLTLLCAFCSSLILAFAGLTPHLTYEVPLPSGGKLTVLDRVLTEEMAEKLQVLLTSHRTVWFFNGFDPSENGECFLLNLFFFCWYHKLPPLSTATLM